MSRRSLVTGGRGFIGRHLVRMLVERGERVRVLDIAEPGPPSGDIEYLHGSILDRDLMRRALKGVDHLYHLAANPELWAADKSEFLRTNHLGTKTVLEEAERAGPERIVYTSTESILKGARARVPKDPGARGTARPTDETVSWTLDEMAGPYCRSKLLAEQEAFAAARRGLPVVIVNPTLPVGAGDHRLTPPTRMILGFLNGRFRAYLDCVLNLVDVRDAALGHVLAAEKGRIGERYILGNENLRMDDLLAMLNELTGLPMPRLSVPYWPVFVASAVSEFVADHVTHRPPTAPLSGVRLARRPMAFDSGKAERELGLPRTPIRDSLADAVLWMEESNLLQRRPLKPIEAAVRAAHLGAVDTRAHRGAAGVRPPAGGRR